MAEETEAKKPKRMLNMFIGEYYYNLDERGRAVIPKNFRDMLGEDFVICKDIYNVFGTHKMPGICVYPTDSYMAMADKVSQMPKQADEVGDVFEEFFANSVYSEPDKLGRVMIPQGLREFAGLEKDIAVIGQRDHLVIYDADKWKTRRQGKEQDPYKSNKLAESFGSVGL